MTVRQGIRFLLSLFLLAVPSVARGGQEKPQAPEIQEEKAAQGPGVVRKVFEIKHVDVNRLSSLLRVFGGNFRSDETLKVITVVARPETVAAVEEALKRLDVPPPPARNIELTGYLLVASEQAVSAAGLPTELEGVIRQLKGVFTYKGFRLLETLMIRSRDGQGGEVRGVVPDETGGDSPASYEFGFRTATIASDDGGQIIRLDHLTLVLQEPGGPKEKAEKEAPGAKSGNWISTNIDVREGQKVVVGKANMDRAGNALILVVTAKVVA